MDRVENLKGVVGDRVPKVNEVVVDGVANFNGLVVDGVANQKKICWMENIISIEWWWMEFQKSTECCRWMKSHWSGGGQSRRSQWSAVGWITNFQRTGSGWGTKSKQSGGGWSTKSQRSAAGWRTLSQRSAAGWSSKAVGGDEGNLWKHILPQNDYLSVVYIDEIMKMDGDKLKQLQHSRPELKSS